MENKGHKQEHNPTGRMCRMRKQENKNAGMQQCPPPTPPHMGCAEHIYVATPPHIPCGGCIPR